MKSFHSRINGIDCWGQTSRSATYRNVDPISVSDPFLALYKYISWSLN